MNDVNAGVLIAAGVSATATVVIAISAIVSAILTWRLTKDNRALLMASTEPRVVVDVASNPRHPTILDLAFVNIGSGAACNVEYEIIADAEEFESHESIHVVPGQRTGLRSVIPQGQEARLHYFGMGPDLLAKDQTLSRFEVRVWYSNLRNEVVESEPMTIDVAQLIGTPAAVADEQRIFQALKSIDRQLKGGTDKIGRKLELIRAAINDANFEI